MLGKTGHFRDSGHRGRLTIFQPETKCERTTLEIGESGQASRKRLRNDSLLHPELGIKGIGVGYEVS